MLQASLATQVYFATGLFGPSYTLLPHRSIFYSEMLRSKYCMPYLPQRTIFHTGLLHALRSHRSLQGVETTDGIKVDKL